MIDGNMIRTYRLLARMSMARVAAALKKSIAHVHNIENNLTRLKPREEKILRDLLGIPEDKPQRQEVEVDHGK